MPIPQLRKKNESWRDGQKKYYVNRPAQTRRNSGKIYYSGSMGGKAFLTDQLRKKLLIAGSALALLILLVGTGMFIWISRSLPDPNHLINRELAQSTKILDRTGETVLYEISGEQKRTLVTLDDIPDYLEQATIVIEDKDFYKHGGFSLWAIFRTVVTNTLTGKKAGGSTLTQQFVKNAILSTEKTYTRKIKEAILAYRMEKKFSKNEILQMYLNEIPYGSTAYGIEAASQKYFGKNVKDINLAEAAILAALPQAPSKYSPFGSNKDLLIARQQYILDLMVKHEYVSAEDAQAAKDFELVFSKQQNNIIAPHFVMYVKEMLSEKYGEKTVEQGGLKIYTTLDLYKQTIAEETIAEITPKNEEKYLATNAALVSIDPKTGQILAMVGSRDYFNEDIDGQVNITTSKRQPGSSLKPLVYATAFLKGYTPNTILYDVVTNFSNDPAKPYEPHNYNESESGPISMRKALAGSLNVPAVKTIYLAGIDNVLDLAQDLGYTTLTDRDRYGLSLVLGGGEVKLLEHANAYSAFAREGYLHPISSILKVEDKDGNILEEFKSDEKKVLDPKIARMVNDVLSDNGARAWVFGEKNYLTLPGRPVAAKTGTTNDYRDAWTMGYTPSLVTGVWVGNADNTEMKRGADGSVVAAPIWNAYMKKVLGDTPVEAFRKAEIPVTGKPVIDGSAGLDSIVKIDRVSGKLATENTPASQIEEKTFSNPHCILYYINKNDPLGEQPSDPASDPQFTLWESRVIAWATKKGLATSTPPTETDNLHIPENLPEIEIVAPGNNDTLTEPWLNVRIDASAPRGINRVEYYINDNLIFSNFNYPFNLERNISFLPNGFYNLKAKACDDIDNCTTAEIEFNFVLPNNSKTTDLQYSLLEPSGGVSLNNIDFPYNIAVSVNQPNLVAAVNFYYTSAAGGPTVLIESRPPGDGNLINSKWMTAPPSGNYKIFVELVTWTKKTLKTDEVTINITNTEDKAPKNTPPAN